MLGAAKLGRNKGCSPSGVHGLRWPLPSGEKWIRKPRVSAGLEVALSKDCEIHSLGQHCQGSSIHNPVEWGKCWWRWDPNSCWSSGKFSSAYREVPVRLEGSFALSGCLALVSVSGHSKMCKSDGKRRGRGGAGQREQERQRSGAGPQPGRAAFPALSLRRGWSGECRARAADGD